MKIYHKLGIHDALLMVFRVLCALANFALSKGTFQSENSGILVFDTTHKQV